MKLGKFLSMMKPTRTYRVICDETIAEFEPDEELPDIIAEAELIASTKDKKTDCIVFKIKQEKQVDDL